MGGGCPLPPLRLQLQQQVAQLGALAREARLGSPAHPPSLADFLGARTHVIDPVHYLLEQFGGYTRIGQGAVGMTRRLVKLDAKPRCRVAQRDAPVAAHVHDRDVKRLQVGPVRRPDRRPKRSNRYNSIFTGAGCSSKNRSTAAPPLEPLRLV